MIEIIVALVIGLIGGYNLNDYQVDLGRYELEKVCRKPYQFFIHNDTLYRCKEYREKLR